MTKFFTAEKADRKWYVVDAKDKVLGRLAAEVAGIIRGKYKPVFTPNMDAGDFVVVINASLVKVTGKRALLKEYHHHSGYPGGLKTQKYQDVLAKNPTFVIENAVRGMLPKTKLGNQLIKKLKVYADDVHPHQAQKPELYSLMEKQ